MAAKEQQLKSQKFNMRWNVEDLELIREAAKIMHIEPSSFIRQQALARAEAIVLEHQQFVLTAEQWQTVSTVFEAPARVLPKLSTIMAESDEWDDED